MQYNLTWIIYIPFEVFQSGPGGLIVSKEEGFIKMKTQQNISIALRDFQLIKRVSRLPSL